MHKLSYSITGVRKHACPSCTQIGLRKLDSDRWTQDAAHQRNLCSYAPSKISDFALVHIRPRKPALHIARFATAIPYSNPGPRQDVCPFGILSRSTSHRNGGRGICRRLQICNFCNAKHIVVLSMYTNMPPVSECGTPHPLACQPCLTGRGTCHPEPWEIANSAVRSCLNKQHCRL